LEILVFNVIITKSNIIIALNKDKASIRALIILPLLKGGFKLAIGSICNIRGVVKVKGVDLSSFKLELKGGAILGPRCLSKSLSNKGIYIKEILLKLKKSL
jgi:hypothetical protein